MKPDLSSERVALGPQLEGFAKAEVIADADGRRVTLQVVATEAGFECSSLTVEDNGGHPVTGEFLRSIPVKSLANEAASFLSFRASPDDLGMSFTDMWDRWPEGVIDEWPRGDIALVQRWTAISYAHAVFRGLGPTKVIREAANVSQATAGRMIRSARDAGFLTTPAPMQSGGKSSTTSKEGLSDA